LKAFGIKTSLDDFGTGYSSLNYLRQFPFDVLKIDQCFVRNISNISHNRTITEATIQMAHNLNLEVVAEGVETSEELNFLVRRGCDVAQGYLFSRPVPALELEGLLTRGYFLALEAHLS
jgi:EAL domain-containing protein (putative c-di-GMP-specific phosphodiesterase class I)